MYLKSIEISYCSRVKSLEGKVIEFDPGLNFIVGENGAGKSTIIQGLSGDDKVESFKFKHVLGDQGESKEQLKTYYFDSEKMNPRIQREFRHGADILSRFVSHGEGIMPCIEMIKQVPGNQTHLILIDEPESGVSPWNQKKLLGLFRERSRECQLIIATHSMIFTNTDIGRVICLGQTITHHLPACTFNWGL
jgi:predicted ATPase